ncbi:MAG: hypothetical protein JSS99_04845 [Actinobacteria bacterium]|nr:hypothetical protein [Actinomycetota bacterium]
MSALPASPPAAASGSAWSDDVLVATLVALMRAGAIASETSHDDYAVARAIDVPKLVATQTKAVDWLSLVRAGSVLDASVWSLPEGSPDARRVASAYRAGYSLVMRRLHLRVPAVAALARRLDQALADAGVLLRQAIRSNLFASPAGATGLALHYDDHDVAVLQLSGEKRWTVYEPVYRHPLEHPAKHLEPEDCRECAFEGVLRPGGLLFIPRGCPHRAHTTEAPSVHITLGATRCTWLDLVQAAAPHAEALRADLPPLAGGRLDSDERLARALMDDEAVAAALGDLAERWTQTATVGAGPPDWDVPSAPLTPASLVRRTVASLSVLVEHADGDATLCNQSLRLRGARDAALLRFLHEREQFAVHELPLEPAPVAQLELVERLLSDGVLERVEA